MNKKTNWIYITLAILAALAMIDAAYLTVLHYTDVPSICDAFAAFDCDIVNKSQYSEIFGVPVAIFGFLTFFAIFSFSLLGLKTHKRKYSKWILALLVISTLFAGYLFYIQAVMLLAWCLMCLILDTIIITSLILAILLYSKINKRK